jgi:hypothetical protein
MKFEPETLFIGIIDLFSIILPGAIATALLRGTAESIPFLAVFLKYSGETAQWVVFLFASYLLGHFIFMFGSFLDEFVYDRLRYPDKDEEAALFKEIANSIDEMNKHGKVALLNEIAKLVKEAAGAVKAEQQSMIESIEKMVKQMRENLKDTKDSALSATLEKMEKELRKYKRHRDWLTWRLIKWMLRSRLSKWAHKTLFSENPNLAVNRAVEIRRGHVADVNGKAVISAFQWSKAHLAIKFPAGLAEVQRFEADSKFFRSLVVVLLILAGWFFWKASGPTWLWFYHTRSLRSFYQLEFKNNQNWLLFLSCLVLSGLSFVRYVERRFKATQQAYWFVITLENSLPPAAAKE